jgi:hypothetical protein
MSLTLHGSPAMILEQIQTPRLGLALLYGASILAGSGSWLLGYSLETCLLAATVVGAVVSIAILRWFGARAVGWNFLILAALSVFRAMLLPPYTGPWLEGLIQTTGLFCTGIGMAWTGSPSDRDKDAVVSISCMLLIGIGISYLLQGGTDIPPIWLATMALLAVLLNSLTEAFNDKLENIDRAWLGACGAFALICGLAVFAWPSLPYHLRDTVRAMLEDYGSLALIIPGFYLAFAVSVISLHGGWRYLTLGLFACAFLFWAFWRIALA